MELDLRIWQDCNLSWKRPLGEGTALVNDHWGRFSFLRERRASWSELSVLRKKKKKK